MGSATVATVAYVPPHATAAPSTFTGTPTAVNFGTSTAQPGNTDVYLYYFIVPYLDAHVLSPPSWRYAYIFWIFITALLVLWTIAHQLTKYANLNQKSPVFQPFRILRSIFIRRLIPSPSSGQSERWYSSTRLTFGQTLTLFTFTSILLAVSLVGDDYIRPTTCTWGGTCPVQIFNQGPPKSTFAPNLRRRDDGVFPAAPQSAEQLLQARHLLQPTKLLPRASALSLNPGGWAPFNDPLLAAPNFDISRNMWTISSRFGLIAYAMIPLVVALGLKAWPFNFFAIPWLTNYGFDKSAVIHRWIGRLIWIWSTIHTVTFSIQLTRDYNPYGDMLITDVWQYYRFNWGVVAYIALTFMVGLSFNPFRDRYYELFYCSHVILSIAFLVGCIIHYEPLWAWSVLALGLWGAERGARLFLWFWLNGLFSSHLGPRRFWKTEPSKPPSHYTSHPTRSLSAPRISLFAYGFGDLQLSQDPYSFDSKRDLHQVDSRTGLVSSADPSPGRQFVSSGLQPKTPTTTLEIPPGFALAQVLPGETLRITLKMVNARTRWSIGQYVLVCIPRVAWWQSHPYTISNSSALSEPGEMVLIVRARGGMTRRLYDQLVAEPRDDPGTNGILIRCQISQPMGSSSRIRWTGSESVLIICGGSGVSFGISLLEELVASLGKSRVKRIRFVWILREHAHLSWVAPALRRCLMMAKPEQVRVDLYVSSTSPTSRRHQPPQVIHHKTFEAAEKGMDPLLAPPHAPFTFNDTLSQQSSSEGEMTMVEIEPVHYPPSTLVEDLTEFDGERQVRTVADEVMSENVRTEGKRRRRHTLSRKKTELFSSSSSSRPPTASSRHTSTARGPGLWNSRVSSTHEEHHQGGVRFDLNELEREDLEDLAEIVRTGRPDLAEILEVESSMSSGKTIVGCCGPSRLSGIVRGLVADRVRDGDQMEIYTEDFSY